MIKCPQKIIDCSVWTGNWAFYYLKYGKLELLKKRLMKYNIVRAYVSPIEAILEQDPMRANLHMYNVIDNMKINSIDNMKPDNLNSEFFLPVPIIDLSFANWKDNIEFAIKRNDVKIVKLLPNYHMYELNEDKLEKLIEYTSKYNLIISIQMRVEDARRHHPLMKIPDVDIIKAVKVISAFPKQKFIICNGYLNDVEQALHFLDNIYVDISSVEAQDVLSYLCDKYGADRLLFSSHSAFYCIEGNVFKLVLSGLDKEYMNKVAYENACKLGL
ncbi:MAG: amidohydrolase family protein [Firmicutes bacterium]|nr:amidohydrolase family protein [Bacillota bacterium]